mgnify:CR=1 FL=1
MKKLATTLSLMVFMMTALFAQEKVQSIEKTGGAEMDFESEVIDYGTIPQNADGVRTFNLTALSRIYRFFGPSWNSTSARTFCI